MARKQLPPSNAMLVLFIVLLCSGSLAAQTPNPNPLLLSPHHATASVADLEKECAWYEHVLGFQETERFKSGSDFEVRHLTIPGYRIDLVQRNGSARHRVTTGDLEQGWFHIVFKTAHIDAAYKSLVAKATDVKPDRNSQSAITRLTVHDPEGNEIEIIP